MVTDKTLIPYVTLLLRKYKNTRLANLYLALWSVGYHKNAVTSGTVKIDMRHADIIQMLSGIRTKSGFNYKFAILTNLKILKKWSNHIYLLSCPRTVLESAQFPIPIADIIDTNLRDAIAEILTKDQQ